MKTAMLHFTSLPTIGGVELVIQAHAEQFAAAGLPLTVITGRGTAESLPKEVKFIRIDELDTLHPEIAKATAILTTGQVPESFESLVQILYEKLAPVLQPFEHVIVHNIFTKNLNLPLTAALFRLMDNNTLRHAVAWCHDLSWTSPRSMHEVYPRYPWTLLKTAHRNSTYVVPSSLRQTELAETFGIPRENVRVISNGVDPVTLLALSAEGSALIEQMNLWRAGMILLMPVRVTAAKNIEYALEVLAELKKLEVHPKLVLTGPPDPHDPISWAYYEKLRGRRRELGLEGDMYFVYEMGPKANTGYIIENDLVAELYRVADILFMPSHSEGFGMPVLEAGLLGMPIVSTNIPAVQDHGEGHTLVFSSDLPAAQLARQMADWIAGKPEHFMRTRVRGRFTWRAIFEREILPLLGLKQIHDR